MIVTYMANQFAQESTALYEQFLDSLQNITLTIKESGTAVSPKILSDAQAIFTDRESVFYDYFSRVYYSLAEIPDDKKLEFWHLQPHLDVDDVLNSCLLANRSTFISAIRFGGAFKGLSGLLKDMHGSMGYLVQKKSRVIQWNVRTKDGRTWSCKRMFFNACRHYAYRLFTLNELLNAKKYNIEVVEIGVRNGEDADRVKLDDLLYSEELVEKFFGYGSQNEVFYEIGRVQDNVIQSK